MVELITDSATEAPTIDFGSAGVQLAGAVYCPSESKRGRVWPERYETFSQEQLPLLLDSGRDLIYSGDVKDIVEQLDRKFPSPSGTTRVYCFQQYVESNSQWSRREGCWAWSPDPIIDVGDHRVIADVGRRIGELGCAVLVGLQQLPESLRSEGAWRRLGYTALIRYDHFMRLNFKPAAAAKTVLAADMEAYENLMRGYFPYAEMFWLRELLGPKEWPRRNRDGTTNPNASALIRLFKLQHKIGWTDPETHKASGKRRGKPSRADNHSSCVIFAEDIINLLKIGRRLFPQADPYWYRGPALKPKLTALLPFLRGAEQYPHKHTTMTAFCRWLRREAKHFELTIPPQPVKPARATKQRAARLPVSSSDATVAPAAKKSAAKKTRRKTNGNQRSKVARRGARRPSSRAADLQ